MKDLEKCRPLMVLKIVNQMKNICIFFIHKTISSAFFNFRILHKY
jgi:hypothetical protein